MQSHIQLFEKYVYLRFGRPYSSLTKDGAAKIVKYKMKTKISLKLQLVKQGKFKYQSV